MPIGRRGPFIPKNAHKIPGLNKEKVSIRLRGTPKEIGKGNLIKKSSVSFECDGKTYLGVVMKDECLLPTHIWNGEHYVEIKEGDERIISPEEMKNKQVVVIEEILE